MAGKGGFLPCDFDECRRGGGERPGTCGEIGRKNGKEYGLYSFRADEKAAEILSHIPEMCYNV